MDTPPPEDRPRYPSLTIGMEFESIEAGVDAIYDAIIKARESFKVVTGTDRFWYAICRQPKATRGENDKDKCPFKISLRNYCITVVLIAL